MKISFRSSMSSLEKKRKLHEKKRKKHKKKSSSLVLPQRTRFSSLPHDLVLSCLARVSKSYYPTLSLVSKSFRSILASPELYKTRSLLNCTESFFYVSLEFPPGQKPHWFSLCWKPNRTLANFTMKKKKKNKPTGNILVPISDPPETGFSSFVVVGSDIYQIGGFCYGPPLTSVSVLDCRSHTWHEAPNMCEKIEYPSANVIDGKIYVLGSMGRDSDSIEVFDLKTHTWEHFSIPCPKISDNMICHTKLIDGKIYMLGDRKGVSYNPKDGTCECVKWIKNMLRGWEISSPCLINNVLFGYHGEEGVLFKWYDTKVRKWRNLKGLKGLPKFPDSTSIKLVDYGGKMVVFWDELVPGRSYSRRTRIWCAEIALERCNEEEISGKVVCVDVVLEVPVCRDILSVLAVTL